MGNDRNYLGTLKQAGEVIPTLNEDVVKPVVNETGKAITVIPRAINAALAPLRKWIARAEYSVQATEGLLAHKLKDIDEGKIVSPDPYVAVPALQAISYSMDNEQLRELYANLLAKAMNIDTKDKVHPSFVEIIKQMSPLDARVLQEILKKLAIYECAPLMDYGYKVDKGLLVNHLSDDPQIFSIDLTETKTVEMTNLHWMTFAPERDICISIDNLNRLGLITICKERLPQIECYDLIRDTCAYQNEAYKIGGMLGLSPFCWLGTLRRPDIRCFEVLKSIHLTDLGSAFCSTCIRSQETENTEKENEEITDTAANTQSDDA